MEWFIFDDLFGINQIYVEKFFGERLHFAVKDGDVDQVVELLAEPGSDINSCYYGENLLWTAIMNEQEEMATFLIDNGIDTTFKCCRIDLKEGEEKGIADADSERRGQAKINMRTLSSKSSADIKSTGEDDSDTSAVADVFVVTCRQLAYEKEMFSIVNYIDFKQGCLLRWLKPPSHAVRIVKSAKRTEAESMKNLVLPPDRRESPTTSVRRRRYKKRMDLLSVRSTPSPAHRITPEPDTKADTKVENKVDAKADTNHHGSDARSSPHEEYIAGDDQFSDTTSTSRKHRKIIPLANHSQTNNYCNHSARIRLTKTSVVRQREVTSAAEEYQYQLRHPENTDSKIKPQVRPGQNNDFERHMSKSMQNIHSLTERLPKVTCSSYGNHLPFRRKPVCSNYFERVFKRSVHSYQHSVQNLTKGKFVGRL